MTESLISDISPAIAITSDELACFTITKHILASHKQLSADDIHYATNYITNFYSYNHVNTDHIVKFLVYADRDGICKFALTFNDKLDTIIKTRDVISLKEMLLGPKEMFIELYDNIFLSNEDREFIIRLISREMYAMTSTISNLIMENFAMPTNNILVQCYDDICIQDANILQDDKTRALMSKYERTPESIYTIDKSKNSSTPHVYYFNTIELIAAVCQNTPVNPQSGEVFSDYTLKIIRRRFYKEIAMYSKYKQIKNLYS